MIPRKEIKAVLDAPTQDLVTLVRDYAGKDPKTFFRNGNWAGADFGEVDVAGFDFSGAEISNMDLSRVKNVEQANFRFSYCRNGPPRFASDAKRAEMLSTTTMDELRCVTQSIETPDETLPPGDEIGVRRAKKDFYSFVMSRLPILCAGSIDPVGAREVGRGALLSMSLNRIETMRVVTNLPTLSQYQIDALKETFVEEHDKFLKEIAPSEHGVLSQTIALAFSKSYGSQAHFDAIQKEIWHKTKIGRVMEDVAKAVDADVLISLGSVALGVEIETDPVDQAAALAAMRRMIRGRQGKSWARLRKAIKFRQGGLVELVGERWAGYLANKGFRHIDLDKRVGLVENQRQAFGVNQAGQAIAAHRAMMRLLSKKQENVVLAKVSSVAADAVSKGTQAFDASTLDLHYAGLLQANRLDDVLRHAEAILADLSEAQSQKDVREKAIALSCMALALMEMQDFGRFHQVLDEYAIVAEQSEGAEADHRRMRLVGQRHYAFLREGRLAEAAVVFETCQARFAKRVPVAARRRWQFLHGNAVEMYLLMGNHAKAQQTAKLVIEDPRNKWQARVIMPYLMWLSDPRSVRLRDLLDGIEDCAWKADAWDMTEINTYIATMPKHRRSEARAVRDHIMGLRSFEALPARLRAQAGPRDITGAEAEA